MRIDAETPLNNTGNSFVSYSCELSKKIRPG